MEPPRSCHPERSAAKSKDLRLSLFPFGFTVLGRIHHAMGMKGGQKVFVILVHPARSPNLSARRRSGSSPQPRPSAHARAGSASSDTRQPSSRRSSGTCAEPRPCSHCFTARPRLQCLILKLVLETREPLVLRIFENSEERIPDLETSEPLAVLEILRKQQIAPRLESSRDDQGVVPRKPALSLEM